MRIPAIVFLLFIITASGPNQSGASSSGQTRVVNVSESNVLSAVADRKKKHPAITPAELSLYANELLQQRGFDYDFDVCDILPRRKRMSTADSLTARHQLSLTNGERATFAFRIDNLQDALCGECFTPLPSLQVTKHEILLLAGGKRYRVRRPPSFTLDEMDLVDSTMKKVLRTWQVPFQTIPVGISADGTKLYLEFWQFGELDDLVLELSADGIPAFRARSEAGLQSEGEWIENFPKDFKNAYLAFKRFKAGNKNYIIKFITPCT